MDQRPEETAAASAQQQTVSQPPLRHQDDADEDDDAVKQLQECTALYLSLQVCFLFSFVGCSDNNMIRSFNLKPWTLILKIYRIV